MKKFILFIPFVLLSACNQDNLLEPESKDEEWVEPEKTYPPLLEVDTTYVIIRDTMSISF